MFGQGLEGLIRQHSDLELLALATDADEALAQIEELCPDVLILSCSDAESDPTPALMRYLRDGKVHKIISVDFQDNSVCVFSGERRLVEAVEDFVETISQVYLSPR